MPSQISVRSARRPRVRTNESGSRPFYAAAAEGTKLVSRLGIDSGYIIEVDIGLRSNQRSE